MTSEPPKPPQTASGRVSVPDELRYTGALPTVVESPSVARRKRIRGSALTAAAGILVFGAISYVVLSPKAPSSSADPSVSGAALATTSASASSSPSASPSPAAPARPSLAATPAITAFTAAAMPKGDLPGWHQTFADDFTESSLTSKWYLYNGPPGGDPLGWFDSKHVSTKNGVLNILAKKQSTPKGMLYASGGMSNSKVFSQKYGRFAVRFRADKGWGIAYSIMLWPYSDTWPPEIDFAEDNGKDRTMTSYTLHYGTSANHIQVHGELTKMDFTQWHVASVDWSPGKLVYALDGRIWSTVTNPNVPDMPMSIAIQSQAWMCNGWEACPNSTTPAQVNLQIDWVVAYSATG
jgi:beta-glucanase (GH16 family)